MNEERLQEIKDSVDFQREVLLANNMGTLCVDEEQELIDEIERLHSIIKEVRAKLYDLNYKIKEIHNVPFDISEIFEIIDLLDKENNNE